MQIQVSVSDGVPIYHQIISQVRYLIAAGRLQPGEELPPIRVLAEQLTVNPNTVARAMMVSRQACSCLSNWCMDICPRDCATMASSS